ncbi:MAG TPA: AhpC/TSA family protein, partial [Chitinophagaceae bacterium]|nr:AhpC/TSA family protein [Chitinophagaceae bacterium]
KKFTGGKGFTVYSVSLDANMDAWKKAITQDNLTWEYHVSDLQGWNSAAAAQYAVTGIPYNFLINEKGIIINKNLRGEQLLLALEKLQAK